MGSRDVRLQQDIGICFRFHPANQCESPKAFNIRNRLPTASESTSTLRLLPCLQQSRSQESC